MSTTTANLGLFKYNTTADANVAFDINTALNNNWDKIDTAMAGGGLPDQTDKDGYILTTNGSEASWGETDEVYPVIETYTNGSSGYRIWSDGYCEQWGRSTINANTWTTVSLLKAYKNLDYNVLACEYNHQNGNDWGAQQGAQPSTTSSIRLATGLDGSVITTWQTWGYIEV